MLTGSNVGDALKGGAGNDRLSGRGGPDALSDEAVDDASHVNFGGTNVMSGGEGDDSFAGRGGDDTMEGGPGADSFGVGDGTSALAGGDGGDRFHIASGGSHTVEGGDGDDSVVRANVASSPSRSSAAIDGGPGRDGVAYDLQAGVDEAPVADPVGARHPAAAAASERGGIPPAAAPRAHGERPHRQHRNAAQDDPGQVGPPRVPGSRMSHPLRATYRLQLTPELDFAAVRELVPYLRELGVSHLYLSPSLQARSGSTHGYDVIDPTRISDTLGGEPAFRELAAAGLGVILDIVPNHMGTGDDNRWWADEELRTKFFDVDPETGHYRRFFDIDDLAALRQEDEEVFSVTHSKVLELVGEGLVDGLRVDHPDGLADPAAYLRRLRDAGAAHVWVEKILHPGEPLRDWPVEGTVGYEFLNDVAALFVDVSAEAAFTELWNGLDGDGRPFEAVALEAQIEQATTTFAREVARLRNLHDVPGIADALAALPVYRTYVEPYAGRVEAEDRAAIAAAEMPAELERILLLEEGGHEEFVSRFQQTSPPVTAKGVEDTAFYRYNRMIALNEVGGDPGRFGITVAEFHAANRIRAERFPLGLLVTQTHDTKRSGDTRARIGALTAMPAEWRAAVGRWREICAPLRARHGGAPDSGEEYLIFQTLVGAHPISAERLEGYLEKALREAKRNTTWVDQDHDYEGRVKAFAVALLTHEPFLADFAPFAARVAEVGDRHALGQLLLKLTSPGIPDIYQGDELLDLALVDPDNRRPVDWEVRRSALAGGGPPKFELIRAALALRNRRPEAFAPGTGTYEPVEAGAETCAFLRGGDVLVVVAIRDPGDAVLATDGAWRDVRSGADRDLAGNMRVADLAGADGLALLERR